MIARKVKPGILELIDAKSADEVESYTLLEITDKDAYLLLSSSKNFSSDGSVTTITYASGDNTDKMFKAIAQKHKEANPTNFIDVSKKYTLGKDVTIEGTSLLLRDPKTHVIKVAYRKTTNSKEGNINRLFVDNATRDKFFNDVRVGKRFKTLGKYELDSSDFDAYSKWSNYMNESYFKILNIIARNKAIARGKKDEL